LERVSLTELTVTDAASSLVMIKSVLDNQPGAARDIVLLNAGAALYAANLTDSIAEGIVIARQAIASGAARGKMTALIECSQQFFAPIA